MASEIQRLNVFISGERLRHAKYILSDQSKSYSKLLEIEFILVKNDTNQFVATGEKRRINPEPDSYED